MGSIKAIILLLAIFALPLAASQKVIGSASIAAPAVLINNNTGTLTNISIVVHTGNGTVKIVGPMEVGNSTLQSAETAAYYAAKYAGLNPKSYNFTYSILDAGSNVSGPSAGAAMTLLAVSALTDKPLIHNFTITGTISANGNIGEVGGLYDKSVAANDAGLSFIIVPENNTRQVEELYLLIQGAFGIPLVQAANITQAAQYAFGTVNGANNGTTYNLYQNIAVSALVSAPQTCSNSCNTTGFYSLSNYTFQFTNSSINTINRPGLAGVVSQMKSAMQEYSALRQKGYIYAASNLAFATYIDSYFFNSYDTNLPAALSATQSIENYCASLSVPQLTQSNYEYVMSGELRQLWGYYTANASLIELNNTKEITTDSILGDLGQTGEANGWCHAANQLYSSGGNAGVPYITLSSLASVATQRLERAGGYGPDIYYNTALLADGSNNYPVAILDADYAYTSGYSNTQDSLPTGQLLNEAKTLAANSTYGIWATQFSNEAYFYIQESGATTNTTQAHGYAASAYFVALLASQISNDTAIINESLVPGIGSPTVGIAPTTTISPISPTETGIASGIAQATANIVTGLEQLINYIYIIAIVNIILTLVLVVAVLAIFQALHRFIKDMEDLTEQNATLRRQRRRRKSNENH